MNQVAARIVAATLPNDLATALLATARDSFTRALVVTAVISAALMIVTAIVGALTWRRMQTGSEPGTSTGTT